MTPVHHAAQTGFAAAATTYEHARPGYPVDAIAHLVNRLALRPGARLLEVGAGTGKLTTLLAPRAHITAVEPVAEMRAILRERLPAIEVLDGRAEAIPALDSAFDAVVVAQAFHWFDGGAALAEIGRVLRPGGRLGLIWNRRDISVPWMARLVDMVFAHQGKTPSYTSGTWEKAFDGNSKFVRLDKSIFKNYLSCRKCDIIQYFSSISFISAMDAEKKSKILYEISEELAELDVKDLQFPFHTDVYIYERSKSLN